MSKLNQWLTLVANISVVVGIVFLAVEMRQNTEAIQAQTRDAVTEKQMGLSTLVATNRELAEIEYLAQRDGLDSLDPVDRLIFSRFRLATFREWENSQYQFVRGLFSEEEYEARVTRWRGTLQIPAIRAVWDANRQSFSAGFRAEIDRILAEVEQAQ